MVVIVVVGVVSGVRSVGIGVFSLIIRGHAASGPSSQVVLHELWLEVGDRTSGSIRIYGLL